MRTRVAGGIAASCSPSTAHSRSTDRVGSISRRLRSSMMTLKISHTSCRATKWSRRSPITCVMRARPQLCNSFRLLLTFERATFKVSAMSSAVKGSLARNSSAWICDTVRLTPQRVPISPQWRIYFCVVGLSSMTFSYFCRYRNVRRYGTRVKHDSSITCGRLAHGTQKGLLRNVQLPVSEIAVGQAMLWCQFGDDVRQCPIVAVAPGREQMVGQVQVQPAQPVAETAQDTRLRRPVASRVKRMLAPVVRQAAIRWRLEKVYLGPVRAQYQRHQHARGHHLAQQICAQHHAPAHMIMQQP